MEDFAQAQALLDAQLRTDWPTLLEGLAQRVNPLRAELFGDFCPGYYWSTYQSEWATDLVFADPASLRRLYPLLVRHGMTHPGERRRAAVPGAASAGSKAAVPGTIRAEVTSE